MAIDLVFLYHHAELKKVWKSLKCFKKLKVKKLKISLKNLKKIIKLKDLKHKTEGKKVAGLKYW